MVTEATIQEAVALLQRAAPGSEVIVFGSYARGTQKEASDLDVLVIEPRVNGLGAEMARLWRVLRPLGIPVDLLVVSRKKFDRWRDVPGTVYFWAAREGRVFDAPA
ncbi:MAG: nucleotidyltransferase domain-containing protein [Candidatus Sericytochromatia bacterium]|nr:nucleotidyltransferase domain-containing protein [Candidatus Tanganyikabacteria bacterium]